MGRYLMVSDAEQPNCGWLDAESAQDALVAWCGSACDQINVYLVEAKHVRQFTLHWDEVALAEDQKGDR